VQVLLMLFVVLALGQVSVGARAPANTVVFVCEHGVAKSVVAAAHFNKLATERGLPFRAVSRGVDLETVVPDRVRDGLRSDGTSLPADFTPTRVSSNDTKAAARVVTFDLTLPPDVLAPAATNWTGVPAVSDGYRAASAEIRTRVEALLNEMSSRKP
jgi:protein-tyrosine-phosphatase